MKTNLVAPCFRFSRNPAEALLFGPDPTGSEAGWVQRGFATLGKFLRDLTTLRQVEYTDLRIDPRRFQDSGGTDFTCAISIDIKFKRLPLIRASGYGYGSSAGDAKLVALAESLERLGFCLRGWHDSALPPRGSTVIETFVATDNTNGACFHTSPLKALKGAFCELLERDAFLTAWYSGCRLPVSDIARDHRLYRWVRRFAVDGWTLREHCWIHDKLPAVYVGLSLMRMAPARNHWNFFLGSGAAPGVGEAQDKALKEMLKSRRLCSRWTVGTSGRVTPAQLRSVESRRLLYQRPAFVHKFTERLAIRPSAAVDIRSRLSDRDFVARCFEAIASAKVVPLLLPSSFRDSAFCVQIVCDELQGLDWQIPPRYNLARIQSLYRTPPGSLCRLPHPLA